KPCPAEWRTFCSSCYLLSAETGSWEKGRQDCRDRGADLVVIDSSEEQNWRTAQPDNGGGDPKWGEEDCAHVGPTTIKWNDLSCEFPMYWI
ncbi:hypothetical protein FQN60_018498, partial [Etheostoma spectabile]